MLSSTQKATCSSKSPFEHLDKLINQKRGLIKAQYDFAVSGGAIGSYKLLDENGDNVILPIKAIITQVYIDIVTAFTSTGGTGTIALSANSSGDLKAAVDADTLSGVVAGIPVGTAASMVKLTAERQILLEVATAALTAGKLNCFVEFAISD